MSHYFARCETEHPILTRARLVSVHIGDHTHKYALRMSLNRLALKKNFVNSLKLFYF